MASLTVTSERGDSVIDYRLDGTILYVELHGVVIFDKKNNIAAADWVKKLCHFIVDNNLHIDDGRGLHAFVLMIGATPHEGIEPDSSPAVPMQEVRGEADAEDKPKEG